MIKNILDNVWFSKEEIFETIAKSKCVKIERIVSNGQSSPDNFWYDQNEYEFVMIVKGSAVLEFEEKTIKLKTDDYIIIEPHRRHRVACTEKPTIWLCVFFK